MFEVPAVHHYDFEIYGSEAKTHAFFRGLESAEIRGGARRYVEPLGDGFVGLVTHSVYDKHGVLISDMFSAFQEARGPKTNPRKLLTFNAATETFERRIDADELDDEVDDGDAEAGDLDTEAADPDAEAEDSSGEPGENHPGEAAEDEPDRGVTTDELYASMLRKVSLHPRHFGREMVATNAGAATLPRTSLRPRVTVDSPKTQDIVRQSLGDPSLLSSSARNVLMRSNYRVPYGLTRNLADDDWSKMHMRRRSLHVVTSLLYLSMERRDYERAWTALTCLLRGNHVDVRLLWMPALELLAWRHSLFPHTSQSPQSLLNWLIATNPRMPKTRHNVHRYLPKSTDLMPVSILLKLVNEELGEAMAEADLAVKSMQYGSDPFCWALSGLARLVRASVDGSATPADARRIQHDFLKCLDLGGSLPNRVRWLAAEFGSPDEETREKLLDGIEESASNSGNSSDSDASSGSDDDNDSDVNNDSHDAESDQNEAPAPKRPKLESSSQHFASQAASLGAELGSSDSDDYL